MKAAVLFESPGSLEIHEVLVDAPEDNEVRIKVAATGLCHTELHFLDGHSPVACPIVLGHEAAGIVEAVGSNVTYVAPGDHVIAFPKPFCGACDYCLSGRATLCQNAARERAVGSAPRLRLESGEALSQYSGIGTFGEEMLVFDNAVVKIRRDVPLECAALLGCAVPTGLGAVLRTARVEAGANVAVIGCGGIGLNVIQGAVLAGAHHIVAIDINEDKLKLARTFGATDTINSAVSNVADELEELLGGLGGVDYSFEAVGRKETYELAFAVLRPGGTATMIGVLHENISIPAYDLFRERKIQGSVIGSVQARHDLPYFLDLYLDGRLKLDELVSNRITLEEINEGYAALAKGSEARSVVLFD